MDEKEAEKKRSLRNEKLKANRTSETEEQRKERLRIRREKDRAKRRTKGKKRSPDTDDYEKQRLATLKLISDCRYRVIESSSLVPVLFREVFSHPYISFFHLLVNGFSVTCKV